MLSISLITSDNSWKKITISYLATSRADFSAGSFYVDLYSLYGCEDRKNNEVAVTKNIGKIPYKKASKVQAFIAGLSSNDKSFDVSLNNVQYNPQTG